MCLVSGVSGEWVVMKSAAARASSSVATQEEPVSFNNGESALTNGSKATGFMPKARAITATLRPMRPKPQMAKVFPSSSTPVQPLRSQPPALVERSACGILRASARAKAMVNSATLVALASSGRNHDHAGFRRGGHVDVIQANTDPANGEQLAARRP